MILSTFRPADGDVSYRAGIGLQREIPLGFAHTGRDIFGAHAPLRHLIAFVDVARLAVVHDQICAAGLRRKNAGIGEQLVLERFQRLRAGLRDRGAA